MVVAGLPCNCGRKGNGKKKGGGSLSFLSFLASASLSSISHTHTQTMILLSRRSS